MVGLNLLRLLVHNRISEFHTDLELMDPEVKLLYLCGLALRRLALQRSGKDLTKAHEHVQPCPSSDRSAEE